MMTAKFSIQSWKKIYVELQIMYVHIMANYSTIKNWLLLRVEDTGYVFLLFSSFFCPCASYCFTSTVSSAPGRSQKFSSKTKYHF